MIPIVLMIFPKSARIRNRVMIKSRKTESQRNPN